MLLNLKKKFLKIAAWNFGKTEVKLLEHEDLVFFIGYLNFRKHKFLFSLYLNLEE